MTNKLQAKLGINKVNSLRNKIDASNEKLAQNYIAIGKIIAEASLWADSKEGKESLRAEGLTKADVLTAYGYSRSWAYKLIAVSNVDDETLAEYLGQGNVEFNVADLLKFINATSEGEGEGEGESKPSTLANLTFHFAEQSVKVKVTDDGKVHTKSDIDSIKLALAELTRIVAEADAQAQAYAKAKAQADAKANPTPIRDFSNVLASVGVDSLKGKGGILNVDSLQYVEFGNETFFNESGELGNAAAEFVASHGWSYQAEEPSHFYVAK